MPISNGREGKGRLSDIQTNSQALAVSLGRKPWPEDMINVIFS
jgi:hypothetical protein